MRLEDELILACTCQNLSEPKKDRIITMLSGAIDWQYVLQASINHAVSPLVFKSLLTIGPDKLPVLIQNKFRKHYQTNVARNLYVTNILLDIVDHFKRKGITSVPFKGPLLAQSLYGDVGLRVFSDLDILVWKHDAPNAIQILAGLEYEPSLNLSPSQMVAYMKYEDDFVLINEKAGVAIELHWEMSGHYLSRPMDMDFVKEGLGTFKLMNKEVQHLSSEDLLVYLCVHGAKHMWERLEWIFCVAELVRGKQNLRWDMVLSKADKLQCRRLVLHSLCLAKDMFQVAVPDNIDRLMLTETQLQDFNEKVKYFLFPLYDETQSGRIGVRLNLFQIQLRDSLIAGLKYGLRELIEPREADWHWLSLPGYLSFLYIFLRPLRQSLKFVDNKLRRVFE